MPFNITPELVRQLMEQNAALLKQNEELPLSTGTIKNMVTRCAASLTDTYERIRCQMTRLGLLHCDETGTRVDGKTWWVQSIKSDRQVGKIQGISLHVYKGSLCQLR